MLVIKRGLISHILRVVAETGRHPHDVIDEMAPTSKFPLTLAQIRASFSAPAPATSGRPCPPPPKPKGPVPFTTKSFHFVPQPEVPVHAPGTPAKPKPTLRPVRKRRSHLPVPVPFMGLNAIGRRTPSKLDLLAEAQAPENRPASILEHMAPIVDALTGIRHNPPDKFAKANVWEMLEERRPRIVEGLPHPVPHWDPLLTCFRPDTPPPLVSAPPEPIKPSLDNLARFFNERRHG